MSSRDTIVVSHANPEDNAFALWLSLKLTSVGYRVWSDVTNLRGGEDFWRDIEPVIRDRSAKLIYVLSRSSNHKEGALRELRVADAVRKLHGLKDFVIPLRIDDLPHHEINIEIGRLNVIESGSWAVGLKQLVDKLAEDGVPRPLTEGPALVRQWWDREFAADGSVSETPEVHYSNWFPVELPDRIFRHSVQGLIEGEPHWSFPARWHNLQLVTFAPAVDVQPGLGTLRIDRTEELDMATFVSSESALRQEHRNIVTQLVTESWEQTLRSRELKSFDMANGRQAFYFDRESLPDSDVEFLSIAGKRTFRGLMGYKTRKNGSRRIWHFAVSARPALHPRPLLQLRAHVLFSDDGKTIWSSADAMHRARRSQCKAWWNDDWRDRLLATMAWLAGQQPAIRLALSGSTEFATVNPRPIEFVSPVTLTEPLSVGSIKDDAPDDEELDEEDGLAADDEADE
jgi:hypothetical protein